MRIASLAGCCLAFGFTLNVFGATLVFTEVGFGDTVTRRNTVAGTQTDLAVHANLDPRPLAVDNVNRKIYYGFHTKLSRMNFDGSGKVDLITLAAGVNVSAIGLDTTNDKIYFATASGTNAARTISSANLDGTGVTKILDNASLAALPTVTVNTIANLDVNPLTGTIYWTADDGGVAGRIALNSATATGSGIVQHWAAASRGSAINDLEFDFDNNKLYYTVGSTAAEVRRSNFDNSSLETLVSGVGRPAALEIDLASDEMFFTVGDKLWQSDLEGAGLTSAQLGTSILYSVSELESLQVVPEPSASVAVLVIGSAAAIRRRRQT